MLLLFEPVANVRIVQLMKCLTSQEVPGLEVVINRIGKRSCAGPVKRILERPCPGVAHLP
jgi:hypothetical protein